MDSMTETHTTSANLSTAQKILAIAILSLVAGLVFIGLVNFYPVGVDWKASYYTPLHGHFLDPYEHSNFEGLPLLLLMVPHALLSLKVGNAINLMVHFAVLATLIWVKKGGWQALVLTFTSPLFLDLVRTNNVDWVPALAFLLPPMWGLPLLAAKPQTVGGAALIWRKREKFSPKMLLPLIGLVVLSLVIWGFWPTEVGLSDVRNQAWNFAPWPLGIPLGIYLLYKGYQLNDEVVAAAATPLLVPYFAPYSLVPLMALLSCKYPKMAFYIYCTFWFYFVIEARRIAAT